MGRFRAARLLFDRRCGEVGGGAIAMAAVSNESCVIGNIPTKGESGMSHRARLMPIWDCRVVSVGS